MTLTWHIVRKDLLRFRFVLLGWVAFLAAKYVTLAIVSGVFGSPNPTWMNRLQLGMPLHALIAGVSPLFALLVVPALVFEDAPTGRDPFWVTRPISGGRLLVAKFLGAIILVIVPLLLGSVAWWVACGLGAGKIVSFSTWHFGIYASVILIAMACASATNSYPRFVVWLIASLAAVIGINTFPLVFHLFESSGGGPVFYGTVLSACLLLLAVEVLLNRYLARRFHAGLVIAATLTLIGSALVFASAPAAIIARLDDKPVELPGDARVQVAVNGGECAVGYAGLAVPLRVTDLPPGTVANVTVTAIWRSAEGKIWTTTSGRSNFRSVQRRMARQVLGLQVDSSSSSADLVTFPLSPANANRIVQQATSIEGIATLRLSQATLLAEIPVQPQVLRFPGGSLTISDVVTGESDVGFLFTTRLTTEPEKYYGVGYIALLNRRTGELIEANKDIPLVGHPLPSHHDTSTESFRLRFKVPDRRWLDEAKFVFVGMRSGRTIERQISPSARQPTQAMVPSAEVFSPPPETLAEYAGTYRPRTGAALAIELRQGRLRMRESGFYDIPLFPESSTRFRIRTGSWLFAAEGDATVEFQRNAIGAVNGFVVRQGTHQYLVPRIDEKK